jgi:Family of unknown function (DUF5723)
VPPNQLLQNKLLMVNILKPFKTVFLVFFCALRLSAQQELMLHTMSDVWHSNTTNPAFFPENKKFILGLPGFGIDAAHSSPITFNDVFVKEGGRSTVNFSNIIDQLDPINELYFDQRYDIANLGVRLPGKIMLTAGYANRLSANIVYPKALPALLWNGNGPYVGQTLELGVKADVADWNEWSIGLGKQFGPLTVGVRAKYLTGISSLLTDPNHQFTAVSTSSDIYQLTLETDYAFYSSAIISAIDTAGLGVDITVVDQAKKLFSKNTGKSFDIGIQYKVNDRLTLDASVLDLGGKIKWNNQANYFSSHGSYVYEGQTLPGIDFINGVDSLDFDTKLDTINDIFNFTKTAGEYSTALPLRAYFGSSFKVGKRWVVGLSGYVNHRGVVGNTYAVGGSVRWKPKNWVSLGAMYSLNQRSVANLGFHLMLKPGPVQVYVASDNLLNAVSAKNSAAVNIRAGISLIL